MTRAWPFFLLVAALPAFADYRVNADALPAEVRAALLEENPGLTERRHSGRDVDALLKRLRLMPGVERATALEDGETLRLRVQLFRKIGRIRFAGQDAMGESEARAAFGLASGDPFEQRQVIEGAERLRLAYRELGAMNPVFDVETPEVSPGVVDLDVKITEGPITRIGEWTVISPDPALNDRYERQLNSRFSGVYTDARLQKAQDFLRADAAATGRLRAEIGAPEARFNAGETRVDLTIRLDHVDEYSVSFRGNRAFSENKLENDVLDLRNFSTANPNITAEMSERIRQAYITEGYPRVDVDAIETDGSKPFKRRIQFDINEGPHVRIEKVDIKGRFSRPASYYADFILRNGTKKEKQTYYVKEEIDAGIQSLVTQLRNEGHLVAKIVSSRTQYSRDGGDVTIFVNLEEGPLTIVDGIRFEGNRHVPAEQLLPLLDLQRGSPLKLNEIERSVQALRAHYLENGYIEMQILNEKSSDLVVYDEGNTKATLVFKIEEGPQVRVASIMLDGNTFTKDYVLLNELDFEVGELLTPAKIDTSVTRLQRTTYFGSVEITTLEAKTAVENRTVIVRVTERNPGTLTFGAGATNEDDLTLRGYAGIGYRNLWGTGRGASIRGEANYNIADDKPFPETKLTFGYLEPYLLNTRNRGRINLSRSMGLDRSVVSRQKVTEKNTATWTIEREFTPQLLGAWDVYSLSTYNDFWRDDSKPPEQLDIVTTTLRMDADFRDSPVNPTRGQFTRVSFDYSSPKIGSRNVDEFYLASAAYNFYLGLPNTRVVWANSFGARYLKSIGAGADGGVPYDKVGLRLGGRSTVRGFEGSEIFPTNAQLGSDAFKLTTTARSGVVKTELRFPLYWDWLQGVTFYDGGAVEIDGLEFDDPYRDAAGFGFHVATPVGPLSLEFAWKLDRKEGEDAMKFHLAVGTF